MYPAGPAWRQCQMLRALWPLLAVLLAPWRLWAEEYIPECTWQVFLVKFNNVGKDDVSDRFFDPEPRRKLDSVFNRLGDSPTDHIEKYLGFPYYLKINYSCGPESSEAQVRKGYLTGLKPVVLVTFQSPVNFHRWRVEQLQIEMEGAPVRSKKPCDAELCAMSWYMPMPMKNGSVVMQVDVSSNGLGPFIQSKRFYVNINGFLWRQQGNTLQFSVGNEIFNPKPRYFVNIPSRPLWHTVNQAPVLILGGIPDEKSILLTDTSFKDSVLLELNLDVCWEGSSYCPQARLTTTICDAIATETMLFIRQNQMVYSFTGTYITLHESNRGSDGRVSFELLPRQRSVCQEIQVINCSIIWAVFIADDFDLLLLVEFEDPTRKYFQVVSYDPVRNDLHVLYTTPEFIPDAQGLEFLVIMGTESYTNVPMVPKGMFYNQHSNLLYIWGNFLLQSYNNENFIYLADFPKEHSIKYLVNSFRGDMAMVTETEEIWYLQEGSYRMYKLFPSMGWETHVSLQAMQQSPAYAPNETMVTLFYEDNKLYQLVYLMNGQQGHLVKRHVPVAQLLRYQQVASHHYLERKGGYLTLSFRNFCPFTAMHLWDLPKPQMYSRQERYRAPPPRILDSSGFHDENSLAVYQGLIHYVLYLHSQYHKPYVDREQEFIGRMWKDKRQYKDYYFYLASNFQTPGNIYIDMASYEKVYDLKAQSDLPERIYLDKGASYVFTVVLRVEKHSLELSPELVFTGEELRSKVYLGVMLADPDCIEAEVKQKVVISRNTVLFRVTLRDKSACFDQGLSGHHLMETSIVLKVAGSAGHCFQNTHQGLRMQGNLMITVLLGCPPGKRLAFDVNHTVHYNRLQNKHYFDCDKVDPEMPCFLYRDVFYPFFLIQDLVTGDSGSFQGSYVLKVVGGGPTLDTLREYSEEEVYHFNSPLDRTESLIWTTKNTTAPTDSAFTIMSNQSVGIRWLCLENSPCYDIIPHTFTSPEFFFKVLVSNRDVDRSTYCDYQLIFLLHIHGLPLSPKRALLIVTVSCCVFIGLVILYIIFCFLLPYLVNVWNRFRNRFRRSTSEPSSSYSDPSRIFSRASKTKSTASSRVALHGSSKVAEARPHAPEGNLKKEK
uniref:Cation channel sperm associated auxiliary subunit gamma n=1 Tax=Suricata suricatta TaxID=37032 RepID=A0A673V1Z0_SURSU